MHRIVLFLSCLALAPLAKADGPAEKPVLVLDAGGHTALVNKVLFTPDGRELITVSNDKTIRFWDVATGEALRVLHPPIGPGPQGKLYAAALSPDGRTLAVAGFGSPVNHTGEILLISTSSGRIERVLKGHINVVHDIQFSPDGRRLASASSDWSVRIWSIEDGRSEQLLVGHSNSVYGVAFSPDGRHLATVAYDMIGRIWSVATGQVEATLRGHTKEIHGVAWSPDGRVIATGGFDRSIRFWNPDGSALKAWENLDASPLSLGFSADSRSLLVTSGQVGPASAVLYDVADRRERIRIRHANTATSGALSPDGTLAASNGGNDQETFLWKTADGSLHHRLAGRGRSAWAGAWSPDGQAIAWGNTAKGTLVPPTTPLEHAFRPSDLEPAPNPDDRFRRGTPTNGSIALETLGQTTLTIKRDGSKAGVLDIQNNTDRINCFSLMPGDRAVVGSEFRLGLYDTRTGSRVRDYRGHSGAVWAVAPSPDGRLFLSASGDQTLRVWDPERDEPILSLFFAGSDGVAWTPEGYYAASPGGEKLMGWLVNRGPEQMAEFYPAAQFHKTLYRPDVIKLILAGGGTERALELADRARGKATEKLDVSEALPPTVVITSPVRSGKTFAEPRLEVKAVATSRGNRPVTTLRLLLDGRPYGGQGGVKVVEARKLGDVVVSWTVDLEPGTHSLTIQAENDRSRGVSSPVEVTYQAEEVVELPSLYVLAIGVTDYPGDLKLHYAAKDAEAIEGVFLSKSVGLYKKIDIKRLTDQGAKRKDILAGLTWLRRQMTQKDVGIVFFSGHGMRDAEGSLYLLPVDAEADDLLATSVSDDQLKKAMAGMPGRVIALLDACHAGALDGDRRKAPPQGLTDDLVRDLVTDDYGVVVMASSTGREFSLENNAERQSNFTLALVEGLSGKADYNHDNVVYLNELDTFVADRVKELSKGLQHPVTARPSSVRSFPLAKRP